MERRTLTPEDMKKLEAMVAAHPVLDNAFRLMSDGHVLFENERYSSVVALSVLCLEEIGKYLITTWTAANPAFQYDRRVLHKMKQGAIAALFMADTVRREYRKRGVDFADLGTPEKMAVLADAIKTGVDKENAFAGSAQSGVLQIVKHSGLYYDEGLAAEGIEPSKIKADDADGMMRTCSRAFMALTDDKAVAIAADFFPLIQKRRGGGSA
jgi:AbiV family abortive infection protein